MFGSIPPVADGEPSFPSLMGDHPASGVAFSGMVDDSYGSADSFDQMYDFLNDHFFPRCAFGPMYLKASKSHFFTPSLEFLGLEGGAERSGR